MAIIEHHEEVRKLRAPADDEIPALDCRLADADFGRGGRKRNETKHQCQQSEARTHRTGFRISPEPQVQPWPMLWRFVKLPERIIMAACG
ncbi:MAG TPA: hypothetical protein VHG33_03575 [Woeseiaceae bacterium]|nr:hypothetical protein [Woeseiaceae bacterium]